MDLKNEGYGYLLNSELDRKELQIPIHTKAELHTPLSRKILIPVGGRDFQLQIGIDIRVKLQTSPSV